MRGRRPAELRERLRRRGYYGLGNAVVFRLTDVAHQRCGRAPAPLEAALRRLHAGS